MLSLSSALRKPLKRFKRSACWPNTLLKQSVNESLGAKIALAFSTEPIMLLKEGVNERGGRAR